MCKEEIQSSPLQFKHSPLSWTVPPGQQQVEREKCLGTYHGEYWGRITERVLFGISSLYRWRCIASKYYIHGFDAVRTSLILASKFFSFQGRALPAENTFGSPPSSVKGCTDLQWPQRRSRSRPTSCTASSWRPSPVSKDVNH